MKKTKYSKREIEIIYQNKELGAAPAQISKLLKKEGFDRSPRVISRYLYDRAKYEPRIKTKMPSAYEHAIEELAKLKAQMLDVVEGHFITVGMTEKAFQKILIFSDLHVPFENPRVVKHGIENHGDAEILVIAGDFFDAYSVSAFRKDKAILFRWEYEQALEYIKLFSSMFKHVVLVSGNHERRVQSYVSHNLGNMVSALVQDDPLKALADGMAYNGRGKLEKLHNFPNVHYDGFPRGDYVRIGKLIVAHPNNYSSIPMRTVTNVAESFLGLEDFEAVVMGHTHQQGRMIWRNKLLLEAGCCCVPLEYSFAQGRLAKLPHTFGYVVAILDKEGHVNFNETRAVYCGVGKIVKKGILE